MFFKKDDPNIKEISFAFGGYKFKIDSKYLYYRSTYGKSFKVLKRNIEGVALGEAGAGKSEIKVLGKGTILATVKFPRIWAEKVQDFVIEEVIDSR